MSENKAICTNGETSSGDRSLEAMNAPQAPLDVWVKIEIDPDEDGSPETETVFDPKDMMEEHTSPSIPISNPEPVKEVFHIVETNQDTSQSEESEDDESESSDDECSNQETDAIMEPEVRLKVKSTPLRASTSKNAGKKAKNHSSDSNAETPSQSTKDDKRKACDKCGRIFRRGSALALHMRSHDAQDNPEYQCQRCRRTFPYHINLYVHQNAGKCKTKQTNTCTICLKECKNKELLRCHMTSHNTERPHKCDLCGKGFKHQRYLRNHMVSHNTVRPYRCEQCGKQFKHSSAAALHRRRHTEVAPKRFSCSVCEKSFTILNALECHMRTHTNERPFACAVCMRAFSHKHNMLRHMQRHDKVLHLKCEVCHKEFPRESRLKYHMRVHWPDKKPYNCAVCHRTYSHVQNITRHYRKKHPDIEYIAPITDAEFANKAWEMRQAQGEIGEREHSSYILPGFDDPNASQPEENQDNPILEPEIVILENNCINIKQEIKQEIC